MLLDFIEPFWPFLRTVFFGVVIDTFFWEPIQYKIHLVIQKMMIKGNVTTMSIWRPRPFFPEFFIKSLEPSCIWKVSEDSFNWGLFADFSIYLTYFDLIKLFRKNLIAYVNKLETSTDMQRKYVQFRIKRHLHLHLLKLSILSSLFAKFVVIVKILIREQNRKSINFSLTKK